jgi:UPF0042 nucleotide-binding protein
MKKTTNINIVIVTGLSGSGKSTVLNVLEDLGFFCVDNLPLVLFAKFFDLCSQTTGKINKAAIGMDIREGGFFKDYPRIFSELKDSGYNFEILFIDCSDEVLVRRFSETRRSHPLSSEGSVVKSIAKEREELAGLKSIATRVIDTTNTNVHQLKKNIKDNYSEFSSAHPMKITLLSFGYKHGIPNYADLVFDVRFLVNPYFVPELKSLTGLDKRVQDFLFNDNEISNTFIDKLFDFFNFLIPLYEKEGKMYLTVAIGCTGGEHRSVSVVDKLASLLKKGYENIIVIHRDMLHNKNV